MICTNAELHLGASLQIGDDAYHVEDPQEYMGRVMGRRAGGELVVEDAIPHMGGVDASKWPAGRPLIIVGVKTKDKIGEPHRAWWNDLFIKMDGDFAIGPTPLEAATNLFGMHCQKYFLPMNAPLPLFKCWLDGKKGSNLFQIVVTNIEDVTSPTGHQWRACFDGEWTWLRATGDTKEEAVAKLRAENPGLVTKPQIMVLSGPILPPGGQMSFSNGSFQSFIPADLAGMASGTMPAVSSSAALMNTAWNWKHQNETVSTDLPAAPEPIKPRRGGPSRVRRSIIL